MALILLMVLVQWAGEPTIRLLQYDRAAIGQGQWWRLLTCNIAHLGWHHCLTNAGALLALVLLYPESLAGRDCPIRLIWLSLGVTFGLLVAVPDLSRYVGASGVLHGLYVLGALEAIRRGDRFAVVLLAVIAAKLIGEVWQGPVAFDKHWIGGRVITESHLFGTFAAAAYAVLQGAVRATTLGGKKR